jgi:hypothetical protein
MFGKVAADILGLSDVGSVIRPENYDKVDADDYVMHEDDEKIIFSSNRGLTNTVLQTMPSFI